MRTRHELWHKENALNLGIAHAIKLDPTTEYIGFVDADVRWAREDWAEETVQQLQHFDVVQMFSQAMDLTPTFEPYDSEKGVIQTGFASAYRRMIAEGLEHTLFPCFGQRLGGRMTFSAQGGYGGYGGAFGMAGDRYWHPGFAWAARRSALDHLGGLIDKAALGAGDHHMAWSLIGQGQHSIHGGIHQNYRDMILLWQERAEKHIRRNIGFVPGAVMHDFHGSKVDRKYRTRWDILVKGGFDPVVDLKRDAQGLYQLTDRSMYLRDAFRDYFRQRNEDNLSL